MISQSEFAVGGGAVAVSDGHSVGVAEAGWTGAAVEVAADAVGVGVIVPVVAEAVIVGVADSAEAGVRQGLVGAAASVEALSMVLICGAMTSAIPKARTTARNPPISAECARGRCVLGLRSRRAARR